MVTVELFAGAGGASLGLIAAGCEEVRAVEFDANACATRRAAGLRTDEGDVRDPAHYAGLGAVDAVWSSFPCFPAGTMVDTDAGPRPIETLSVGDRVLTHLGRFRAVTSTMRRRAGALVEVAAKAGRGPIRCTAEHPFFVRRGGEAQWIEAANLRAGDMLLTPHLREAPPPPTLRYTKVVSVGGRGAPRGELRTYDATLPWGDLALASLLGAYLADGHLQGESPTAPGQGATRRATFFSVRAEKVPRLLSWIERCGWHATVWQHTPSCCRLAVSSLDLWTICNELGRGAQNKRVPPWLMGRGRPWRKALLEGYLHGDGCERANSGGGRIAHVPTVSATLATDTARLVADVYGVVPSIRVSHVARAYTIEGRTVQGRDCYDVRWCPPSARKRQDFVDEYGAWAPVVSITPVADDVDVFNVSVDEDESYTAAGRAVHNCQAWSSAGKRLGAADERNGWPWTVDVLDRVNPRWFIAENVPGLTHHRGDCDRSGAPESCPGCYFERRILPDVAARFPWSSWTILDSADYGVPQRRRRIYIVGGPRPMRWPQPTHTDPDALRQGSMFGPPLLPWRTVREALRLNERVYGGGRRGHGMAEWEPQDVTDRPAATINAMQSSTAAHYVVDQTVGSSQTIGRKAGRTPCESSVDAPAPTVRACEGVGLTIQVEPWPAWRDRCVPLGGTWYDYAMAAGHPEDAMHPDGVTRRLVSPVPMPAWAGEPKTRAASRPQLLDKPSPAVTAVGECKGSGDGGNPEKMQRASDALWLGAGIRRLTVAECAALMSWPDGYPLRGTKTSQYAQVGNGCTPPVVEALARAVIAADRERP